MATSLPWYKEVSPTQKKALFAAWLGYVFDVWGSDNICIKEKKKFGGKNLA